MDRLTYERLLRGFIFFAMLYVPFVFCEQTHHSYISKKEWAKIEPYLMPDDHPLKEKLDELFSKKRVLRSQRTLVKAGFEKKNPEPHTKIIVTRHKDMPGYMFKIYTDDKKPYYRGEPEYITWMLRARGAKIIGEEIVSLGLEEYFKAPKKWIYALPPKPKARSAHLQKNFILVEEEMDILANKETRQKWKNGEITQDQLEKLFFLITRVGLRGGCKYDNVPVCKDGRMAFIDTQNNLRWPLPYKRLYKVLQGDMRMQWKGLVKNQDTVPRVSKTRR